MVNGLHLSNSIRDEGLGVMNIERNCGLVFDGGGWDLWN